MPTATIERFTGLSAMLTSISVSSPHIVTENLTPFWRELGEHLADEAQRRWPLTPHVPDGSGASLVVGAWPTRLGKHGVFEASTATRLTFGTDLFYGRFAQHGTTTPAQNSADSRRRGRRAQSA